MKQAGNSYRSYPDVAPEYYVLLCARRYVETSKRLTLAATKIERSQLRRRLSYVLESGIIEADYERERRLRGCPRVIRAALLGTNKTNRSLKFGTEELEMIIDVLSVPPIASIGVLSAGDMENLADLFEGWAQSDVTDSLNVGRSLGWANGLRQLAETVGANFFPPCAVPDDPTTLLAFLAQTMKS